MKVFKRTYPLTLIVLYRRCLKLLHSDGRIYTFTFIDFLKSTKFVAWARFLLLCFAFVCCSRSANASPTNPELENAPRVLNNLVVELLDSQCSSTASTIFRSLRDGWIYVAVSRPQIMTTAGSVIIDNAEYPLRQVAGYLETMRYLPKGWHSIRLSNELGMAKLTVRAVPELFYNMYGVDPLVPETAHYSWDWLRKHILVHYNSVIGIQYAEKQSKEIEEWVGIGGRWFTECGVAWEENTGKGVFKYWSNQPGMMHPLLNGMWINEFWADDKYQKKYPVWRDALRRIAKDPHLDSRQVYAYTGMLYDHRYDPLLKIIAENGYYIGPEWYLTEQPSEEQLSVHINLGRLRDNRTRLDDAWPDLASNRVIVLALLSQPEESCDIRPDVNYNVFLDMQFQIIANDPAFTGTRGLQGYYSRYAGEEQSRVFARLIRHYAIEGHKDRLLKDPYLLTHLRNPDFVNGTSGWLLSAAENDSIRPCKVGGFGWLQGRFDRSGIGDGALVTKRSKDKPNVFTQEMISLEPGRAYSLRFFTGNYQNYLAGKSLDYKHSVSVSIDNADLVPEKCFQARIKSSYGHTYKSFDASNPYRLNYYQFVFRPRGEKALLEFSDWVSRTAPGGPEGEELMWNFIQVQPYFVEE